MARRKIPEEDKQKAAELYKSGLSIKKTAEQTNMDERTIERIVENIERDTQTGNKRKMTEQEKREWDFWAAVIRGDLLITTKEAASELQKPQDISAGAGRFNHGSANTSHHRHSQSPDETKRIQKTGKKRIKEMTERCS